MSNKDDVLMTTLSEFFRTPDNINKMLEITETKTSPISLRLLDWFATNYSKKYGTVIDDKSTGLPINIYFDYKNQLSSYKKTRFDPFCRQDRIKFYHDVDKSTRTTIAQLNFFKWVISKGVLDYVNEHIPEITLDMTRVSKNKAEPKAKRTLITPTQKTMTYTTKTTIVDFN